ncbi:MAG TPA: AI-2E family transporter, partial [Burkholderiaceae bacterium]|nr:AI-2E family transporter [Burkholderiaceae bacterium]
MDAVAAAKVIKIPACQLPMHAVKRLRLAARAALAKTQQLPGVNIASASSMLDSDLFPITPTFSASRSPPMNTPQEIDHALEERLSRRLLDTLIRAGLVFALVWLCFHFFAPFLTMMLWALILAVTLYPLHQMLAKRIGGRQGGAATLIVVLGLGLIVVPTVILGSSFGDSVHGLIVRIDDPYAATS